MMTMQTVDEIISTVERR